MNRNLFYQRFKKAGNIQISLKIVLTFSSCNSNFPRFSRSVNDLRRKPSIFIHFQEFFWTCIRYIRYMHTALQIRASQKSITTDFWPLIAHIYHVMIIMTGGFSRISLLFPRNYFERS